MTSFSHFHFILQFTTKLLAFLFCRNSVLKADLVVSHGLYPCNGLANISVASDVDEELPLSLILHVQR